MLKDLLMKLLATLDLELTSIYDEVNRYLAENPFYLSPLPPFKRVMELDLLHDKLPSLFAAIANENLTIKALYFYTAYYIETANVSPDPFIIIPFKNFETTGLVFHSLKEDATERFSEYTGKMYYSIDDADEQESILYEPNKIYFVNSNQYTSTRYHQNVSIDEASNLGVFLTVFVNEDLSNYFNE